jgi:hypothetical protein
MTITNYTGAVIASDRRERSNPGSGRSGGPEPCEYAVTKLLALKFPSAGGVARSAGVVALIQPHERQGTPHGQAIAGRASRRALSLLTIAGVFDIETTPPCGHPSKGGE